MNSKGQPGSDLSLDLELEAVGSWAPAPRASVNLASDFSTSDVRPSLCQLRSHLQAACRGDELEGPCCVGKGVPTPLGGGHHLVLPVSPTPSEVCSVPGSGKPRPGAQLADVSVLQDFHFIYLQGIVVSFALLLP